MKYVLISWLVSEMVKVQILTNYFVELNSPRTWDFCDSAFEMGWGGVKRKNVKGFTKRFLYSSSKRPPINWQMTASAVAVLETCRSHALKLKNRPSSPQVITFLLTARDANLAPRHGLALPSLSTTSFHGCVNSIHSICVSTGDVMLEKDVMSILYDVSI